MSKFRQNKTSFLAGEISPTAMGRTDLPQYLAACETLRNAIPVLSGGAYRRPGSLFQIEKLAATNYAPRVLQFVVSKSESYALLIGKTVAGTCYIEAYRPTDNHSIPSPATVTGAPPWQPALQGGGSPSYFYDQWSEVQFAQSVDVMFLVHPNYKPYKLSRTAVDTFTLAAFDSGLTLDDFRDAYPYQDQNITSITLSINTATVGTGRTLTASASLFTAAHVGVVYKVNNAGTYGCCRVTAYISATQVTVEVIDPFGAAGAPVLTWSESAWSDLRGWPRSVSLHQARLIYGGNATFRDSLWASKANNLNIFSVSTVTLPRSGPTGEQPFTLNLASNQLNLIQWQSAERTLIVGTLGDEFILEALDPTVGFACNNVSATAQSHYGSSYNQAVRIAGELAFCRSSQDEIRTLIFNVIENTYTAEPVQLLFDHYPKIEKGTFKLGDRKIRSFAWDEYRSTLWCCDTMGNLFGMTRDRRLQVSLWHTHQMGGFDSTLTGGTAGSGATLTIDPATIICSGSVISIAVMPNPSNGGNDLWLVVKRKINSVFTYQLERIIGKAYVADSAYDPIAVGSYFSDACAYDLNDFPSTEDYIFTGLGHLVGQIPTGTASNTNGLFTISGSAVSGSNTTIQHAYPTGLASVLTIVSFGLGFSTIIKPVRTEAGSQLGSSQATLKRIHEVSPRFYKTLSAKVGSAADNVETIIFREASADIGKSPELFTGDKLIKLNADYDRDGYIYILQDKPLPFYLVSITVEGVNYD